LCFVDIKFEKYFLFLGKIKMIVFVSLIAVIGIYGIFTSFYIGYFSWFRPEEFLAKSDPLVKQKRTNYHFFTDAIDGMFFNYFGNNKLYLWLSRVGSVLGLLLGLVYLSIFFLYLF
jgi:hypothetical protein